MNLCAMYILPVSVISRDVMNNIRYQISILGNINSGRNYKFFIYILLYNQIKKHFSFIRIIQLNHLSVEQSPFF